MKHAILLLAIILTICMNMNAQQVQNNNAPSRQSRDKSISPKGGELFSMEAAYTGDLAGNITGGIETGAVYLGLANIKLSLETKNLDLWNGGEFFINGACTHGATPSEKLLGDFQVASNIEAGNHIYLQELWYKQTFGDADFTIGLQDLNSQFVTSEYAGSFLNSSFGIPSVISDNVPVPIFPFTALGIAGSYNVGKSLTVRAALFDGMPGLFESNGQNIAWQLNKEDGILMFTEFQYSTGIAHLTGTYKIGGYYHNHLKEKCEATGIDETVFDKNYGIYFIADQTIWQKNEHHRIGFFTQLTYSPAQINVHNFYFGCGVNYSGLLDTNGKDALGLAVANASFNCNYLKNETVIEMFYKSTITENLFLQPDIQYIINPAGTGGNLNNALAVIIRFGINF